MNAKAVVICFLLADAAFAEDGKGFNNFSAPGVVGAYASEWTPLGITDQGYDFSIGFYLDGDGQSDPLRFWIKKGAKKGIEIDSIGAVNTVLSEFDGKQAAISNPKEISHMISLARWLLSTPVLNRGQTGFPLKFEPDRELATAISRLQKMGLDSATCALLLKLGSESAETVKLNDNLWYAEWFEVTKMGGIEKASIKGTIEPMAVTNLVRELVFAPGKVKVELLRRENLVDLSIAR